MKPLNLQLHEIRDGGWPVFRRKLHILLSLLFRGASLLLHAPWAIPGVLLIRCLRPWRLIRLGTFNSSRIGHFAPDVSHQLIMRQIASKKTLDLYWLPSVTCNEFWAKMVRRNFTVYPWLRRLDEWNQKIPGGAIHHRPSTTTNSRDIHGWFEKNPTRLTFLPEEDKQAKTWFRRQGWQEGEPFICLNVRDSAYLNTDSLHKGYDWNYHNYRNSDISTYVPAAEWLAEQGVWVLRMGKIMAKPMPSSHPRIIDYAFHPEKNDFLDIWLFAHCNLCISTSSGPDWVSSIYRIPLLFVNFLPLIDLWSWSNAMHIPKTLVWEASGIPLTWQEHLDHGYFYTEYYTQAGIKIIDLTPGEILSAVQERWQRLQGTWVETDADFKRHHRFWNILKAHPDFDKYHSWIHPEARAGDTFLRFRGDEFLA
ncbi:MAG: TIGR04372 family glycosyltransferase [Xenococcaceae cyanobacterium]